MSLARKKLLHTEMIVVHSVYCKGKIFCIDDDYAFVSFSPYSKKVKLSELKLFKDGVK